MTSHAVHNHQTDNIDFVGHFASWHRYFVHEYERTLRDVCEDKGSQPYWDWSMDSQPNNNLSTAVYDTVLFSNTEGFGGNGKYLDLPSYFPEAMANMFNGWGRSGGGCVQEGPFTVPNFHVDIGEANGTSCLRRDFMPAILHNDANPAEVQKVLDQLDSASFDRQMESEPDCFPPAIHAGGHFGIGGMLGQAGKRSQQPWRTPLLHAPRHDRLRLLEVAADRPRGQAPPGRRPREALRLHRHQRDA